MFFLFLLLLHLLLSFSGSASYPFSVASFSSSSTSPSCVFTFYTDTDTDMSLVRVPSTHVLYIFLQYYSYRMSKCMPFQHTFSNTTSENVEYFFLSRSTYYFNNSDWMTRQSPKQFRTTQFNDNNVTQHISISKIKVIGSNR